MILDNVWRSFVFENGVSFLPGGAFPAIIAVEFQFVITHHLRPAPDAAAFTCSNCGRQHRAEECPSFNAGLQAHVRPVRLPPAPRPLVEP